MPISCRNLPPSRYPEPPLPDYEETQREQEQEPQSEKQSEKQPEPEYVPRPERRFGPDPATLPPLRDDDTEMNDDKDNEADDSWAALDSMKDS